MDTDEAGGSNNINPNDVGHDGGRLRLCLTNVLSCVACVVNTADVQPVWTDTKMSQFKVDVESDLAGQRINHRKHFRNGQRAEVVLKD